MRFDSVAIVGVGLIGGSIGLAVRRRHLAERVIGIGRRQSSLQTALRVGAVTETTTDLARGVAQAERVVVCTPVGLVVDFVLRVAEHCPPDALLTDAGSTKAAIVEALDGRLPGDCRYVGSHPVAGSEKTGAANARAELFEGRTTVLTPTERSRPRDVDQWKAFWSALGSEVEVMSPQAHDRALAATSHMPHAVAVALAASLPERWARLAGTGFRDTSRLGSGDPGLWRQIFSQNGRNVAEAIEAFEQQLGLLKEAIRRENEAELETLLEEAKRKRDALGS